MRTVTLALVILLGGGGGIWVLGMTANLAGSVRINSGFVTDTEAQEQRRKS